MNIGNYKCDPWIPANVSYKKKKKKKKIKKWYTWLKKKGIQMIHSQKKKPLKKQ